jgi:hypothetical protein
MLAIRVQRRAQAGGYTAHWLLDPGRTYCGRDPAGLDVVEEVELERLPPVEACRSCERAAAGWTPDAPGSSGYLGEARVTAAPAAGRLRTTGPLAHGSRARGSRRLG